MYDEAIEAFWKWWETGRELLEEAVADGGPTDLPETITGLVADIHPELQWQLAPGPAATHALALSAGGDPSLRLVTQRWVDLGSDATETWEYHPARVAAALAPFEMDDVLVDSKAAVIVTAEDLLYEQLEVTIYVPGFEQVTPEVQMRVALLLLDATLGEDDVERWVGFIDTVDEPPAGGAPLRTLPEIVSAFSSTTTGEQWDVVEEQEPGALPAISSINRALKPLDYLRYTFHLEMIIEMNQWTDLGLPTEDESEDLTLLEEDLIHTLGDTAIFAARETEDCIRRLHFFVRPFETVEESIDEWVESIGSHTIEPVLSLDPDWAIRARWS